MWRGDVLQLEAARRHAIHSPLYLTRHAEFEASQLILLDLRRFYC